MKLAAVKLASRIIPVIAALAIMAATSSCNSKTNQLTYFNNLEGKLSGELATTAYKVRIVPDDELAITVNSQSAAATAPYNLPMFNDMTQADLVNSALGESYTNAPKTQTYIVNSQGNITMPNIGEIHVEGMTLEELTGYITAKVSTEVKDPIVRVALVNFTVNILGEVENPKRINVRTERFSVLDALAESGDLTEYGKRDNVIVIREQDGKVTYQRLDLRDANIVSSPYYYLQQNDVVYVEPNNIKASNSRYNTMNSYKLSAISTTVSAVSVIASLIIALAVK